MVSTDLFTNDLCFKVQDSTNAFMMRLFFASWPLDCPFVVAMSDYGGVASRDRIDARRTTNKPKFLEKEAVFANRQLEQQETLRPS